MCFWRQSPSFLYFTRTSQCDQTKLQRILTADTHRGLLCVKHCSSYFILTDSLNPHKNLVNYYYYILFIKLNNCNIGELRNLPKITMILSVLCLLFGGFPCPQDKIKSQLLSKILHDLNLRSCSPPPKPMVQPHEPSPQFLNTLFLLFPTPACLSQVLGPSLLVFWSNSYPYFMIQSKCHFLNKAFPGIFPAFWCSSCTHTVPTGQ